MATWTDIADARLEPGKPARSVDAVALRDNPIAIAEGAENAPRIQTAAIEDSAVTSQKINSVAWGKVTGRPALGVYYSTSEYVMSTQRVATGFMAVRAPSGYVLTGLEGRIGGDGFTLAGMTEIINVYARALAV